MTSRLLSLLLLVTVSQVRVPLSEKADPRILNSGHEGKNYFMVLRLPRTWKYHIRFECDGFDDAAADVDGPGISRVELVPPPGSELTYCVIRDWRRVGE